MTVDPPTLPPQQNIPDQNETLLSREMLCTVLADLSARIFTLFRHPVRLVVHGGAAMLLHPGLYDQPGSRRRATRDVDYIHRGFIEEWRQFGMPDAGERLQYCIDATAVKFKLGKDWMNAHADIALPMATDNQGRRYDPIYTASLKPNNVHLHTVYTSPGLTLVSVTPFWAVALKLVRYQKHDPADITAILRNGTRLNGVQWSGEILENWLQTECWAMGYKSYPDWLKRDMRERIRHAVTQLTEGPPPPPPAPPSSNDTQVPIRANSLDSSLPQQQQQHRALTRHRSMTFHSSDPSPQQHQQHQHHPTSMHFAAEHAPQPPPHRHLSRRSSTDFPVVPFIPRAPTPRDEHAPAISMPVPHIPATNNAHTHTHNSNTTNTTNTATASTIPVPDAPSRLITPQIPMPEPHAHSRSRFPVPPPSSLSTIPAIAPRSHHIHHPMLMPPPPPPQLPLAPPLAPPPPHHHFHHHGHMNGPGWTPQLFITA